MLLRDDLGEYLATNPRITSPRTGQRYWTMLSNFERHVGRPPNRDDLTADSYGRWIKARRDSGAVTGGTIRGEAEKLLVLWRWVAARSEVEPPNVALPPSAGSEPVAWTPEELRRLEEAAKNSRRRIGDVAGSIYWPAFIALAIDTGERVEAIHSLDSADIDLAALVVTYHRETRKGKRLTIRRSIDRTTAPKVARLLKVRPVAPFAPIKATSLYMPLRWLLVDAGLPRDRCRMFHCLRRTHATMLHRQGGDVQASLGHADPKTTWGYIDKTQAGTMLPTRERQALVTWFASRAKRVLGLTG